MSDKSPREIEHEIERERAELAASLDALTDKFSMDNMVRTVSDQVTQHGGEAASNFASTVKANPAAAVLAGVGIAWLIASGAKRGSDASRARVAGPYVDSDWDGRDRALAPGDTSREFATRRDLTPEWEEGGTGDADDGLATRRDLTPDRDGTRPAAATGSPSPSPRPAYATTDSMPTATGFRRGPTGDFDDRLEAADARMRAGARGTSGHYADADDDDGGLIDRAQGIWDQVTGRVRQGYASARGYAEDLRDNLMEGTDDMDSQGQDRVAQARARAYAAQARAEMMSRRAKNEAAGFFYENPLVTGALALAAGALVGAALPRTQREDEAFGTYRDSLFEEAERVYHEERARAEAAGAAALREAKQVALDAKDKVTGGMDGKETVHEAEAAGRSAVTRVADAAKDAAARG